MFLLNSISCGTELILHPSLCEHKHEFLFFSKLFHHIKCFHDSVLYQFNLENIMGLDWERRLLHPALHWIYFLHVRSVSIIRIQREKCYFSIWHGWYTATWQSLSQAHFRGISIFQYCLHFCVQMSRSSVCGSLQTTCTIQWCEGVKGSFSGRPN